MRPRFSLRTLLILTTLAALACGWLIIPSLRAERFIAAIHRDDLTAADKMIRGGGTTIREWRARPSIDGIRAYVFPLGLPRSSTTIARKTAQCFTVMLRSRSILSA
jgi:hypothetical protein